MNFILGIWKANIDMDTGKNDLTIGIALSGGGVRASVFHLGVLGRLAADNMLENITFISTVSGGTLVTGLIYSTSGYLWPTSDLYIRQCLPQIRQHLTRIDLEQDIVRRSIFRPWYLMQGRAKVVSQSMQHRWGITGTLNDIPMEPRWVLNATTYETGRNWRFIPQKRMGDYVANYVKTPSIPLTDAMAASAAYPGLIGPLVLNTSEYHWFRYVDGKEMPVSPGFQRLHLWDGGLYDNLGVESLFKIAGNTYRDEFNFLIVSDASSGTSLCAYPISLWGRGRRLVGIALDQARGLRARTLVNHLQQNEYSGVYLKMGNTGRKILADAGIDKQSIDEYTRDCLDESQVQTAVNFPTTLRRLTDAEYDLLFEHGWEVADHTLKSRCRGLFGTIRHRKV